MRRTTKPHKAPQSRLVGIRKGELQIIVAGSGGAPLEETCLYCGRVRWGNYQYLLNRKWRHEECVPGSPSWVEWYDQHTEAHTSAGDALRKQSSK
jgi:hypothetical protein